MNKSRFGKIVLTLVTVAFLAGGLTGVASAADFKHYVVRVRGLAVIPNESADSRLASLDLDVTNDVTPELDLEYYFSPRFSSELILGVTKHDIKANGQFAGSTWLLPPTLTVKYHPFPNAKVSPYIGFGINYVIPFDEKFNNVPDFNIDSSFGWAVQVGTDVALGNSWYANFDVKYLNVETKARIAGTKYDLDLNPLVIGMGVGYRF